MEKKRKGYKWIETSSGGYWSREKGRGANPSKKPFFCPRCKEATATLDDKYVEEYGVCSKCYVLNIESRKEPLIDVEFYKKRLKERGY